MNFVYIDCNNIFSDNYAVALNSGKYASILVPNHQATARGGERIKENRKKKNTKGKRRENTRNQGKRNQGKRNSGRIKMWKEMKKERTMSLMLSQQTTMPLLALLMMINFFNRCLCQKSI